MMAKDTALVKIPALDSAQLPELQNAASWQSKIKSEYTNPQKVAYTFHIGLGSYESFDSM
ncbi:unnamed protein product [Diplocarpon coronariae]